MAPDAPTIGISEPGASSEKNSVAATPVSRYQNRYLHRPEAVLDVVAVDPEEQHVPEQVHEAAVQEHRREQVGQAGRARLEAVLEDEQVVDADRADDLAQRDARRE